MKFIKRIPPRAIAVFFFTLLFSKPAYAYIGPGTITLIIQLLIGLLAGGAAVIIMSWSKIRDRLLNNKPK